jgi:hypothetical protein
MVSYAAMRRKIGVALSAAALASAVAWPALAAPDPGWRVVLSLHHGAPGSYSAFWAGAAVSNRDAWAVGGLNVAAAGQPAAYQWTGKHWHASPLPHGLHNSLVALSAPAGTDIWAVSGEGGYILHYNGTRWSVARKRFTGIGELTGVTAFSPSDAWVFGGPGAGPGDGTWHYDGRSWSQSAGASQLGITTASAVSPTDMWAIGSRNSPQDSLARYTGTWRLVSARALAGLQFTSILALSSQDVWAAGFSQTKLFTSYLLHKTSSGWARVKVPYSVDVGDLTSDGRGGLWVTGAGSAGPTRAMHLSATGHWSSTLLGKSSHLIGLSRIPGTTSLLGFGSAYTKLGSNAIIWRHGRIS